MLDAGGENTRRLGNDKSCRQLSFIGRAPAMKKTVAGRASPLRALKGGKKFSFQGPRALLEQRRSWHTGIGRGAAGRPNVRDPLRQTRVAFAWLPPSGAARLSREVASAALPRKASAAPWGRCDLRAGLRLPRGAYLLLVYRRKLGPMGVVSSGVVLFFCGSRLVCLGAQACRT